MPLVIARWALRNRQMDQYGYSLRRAKVFVISKIG